MNKNIRTCPGNRRETLQQLEAKVEHDAMIKLALKRLPHHTRVRELREHISFGLFYLYSRHSTS